MARPARFERATAWFVDSFATWGIVLNARYLLCWCVPLTTTYNDDIWLISISQNSTMGQFSRLYGHNMAEISNSKSPTLPQGLSKEQLKSYFYLFSGKPDSKVKVFNTPIFIEPQDIRELNDCVTRKLNVHNIDAQVTSLQVGYEGDQISEFGSWAEFDTHHWQESDKIEEIVIKWDFLVQLREYEAPQRHTLLVRISSDLKQGRLMQMLMSGNSDEFDKVDIMSAPAFCRVDFINAQISKELINVVTDWYEGRKSPALIPPVYFWLKQHRNLIGNLILDLTSLMYAVIWISFLLWSNTNWYQGNQPVEIMFAWLFFGIALFSIARKIGDRLARAVFNALKELDGSRVVFSFTTGDKKQSAEALQRNRQSGKKFVIKTLGALTVNIAGGIIAALLYSNS
jgi:hypothetical protein